MKYCGNCGKEVNPGQAVCLNCGFATNKPQVVVQNRQDGKALGTISIIFGILGFYPLSLIGSIIGLIIGIVGMTDGNNASRGRAKTGFWISLVSLLFWMVMVILIIMLVVIFGKGKPPA
ncbi:MAG: hypothetical protein ACOX02_02640 [Acholeplasmatales bacterium]